MTAHRRKSIFALLNKTAVLCWFTDGTFQFPTLHKRHWIVPLPVRKWGQKLTWLHLTTSIVLQVALLKLVATDGVVWPCDADILLLQLHEQTHPIMVVNHSWFSHGNIFSVSLCAIPFVKMSACTHVSYKLYLIVDNLPRPRPYLSQSFRIKSPAYKAHVGFKTVIFTIVWSMSSSICT